MVSVSSGMSYNKDSGMLVKTSGGNWASGTAGFEFSGANEVFFNGYNGCHVVLGFTMGPW
eukprot:TRINITY_DN2643_c0_g1_i1.p1 TRINITY_DN2643_c0_g1~~TRINITY_DN2643_c0_g1_i1.p1  ORF type:complete len:60 (-),score=9.71 TRINITY_DN2643_c0_g1_i1:201-380(-)